MKNKVLPKNLVTEYAIVEELLTTLQQSLFDVLIYFENSNNMTAIADECIDDLDRLIFYCQECENVLRSVNETA